MAEQITPEALRELMDGFSGTENYYATLTCRITDGMKAVLEAAGAGWLVVDIGAYSIKKQFNRTHPIIFWVLKVKDDHTADLEAWDDIPGNRLFKKHYSFTDFPVGEWKFYYQQGVLFLPSEY